MLPSNARHADSRNCFPEPVAGAHQDIRVQKTKRTQSTFSENHIYLYLAAEANRTMTAVKCSVASTSVPVQRFRRPSPSENTWAESHAAIREVALRS